MKRPRDQQYAYEMGKDSVMNGANTTNCNFRIFATQELMKAWEQGIKDAKKEREAANDSHRISKVL